MTDYPLCTNSENVNQRVVIDGLSVGKNIRKIPAMIGPGIECNPLPRYDRVISVDVYGSSSHPAAVGGNSPITPTTNPGERRIYSVGYIDPNDLDAGCEIKAQVIFGNDGTITLQQMTPDGGSVTLLPSGELQITATKPVKIDGEFVELNGADKTFVTHAELDTALQTFITALNLHTHPTAAVGAPSPPTASMSLDISGAATTTVKTGG